MIFREEKYMKINGITMGKNGFKSLTFETSKYSGSFSASRGFGIFFNEKNLNQIDVFNVEFVVTKDELEDFAYVYAQFKAFGVLPIENEYILNKIKSTLAYEKSLLNLESGKSTNRVLSHINVFLEAIQIRSLERTSNGYGVTMTLSLNRFGFSKSEFEKYQTNFRKWNDETKFSEICLRGIKENSEIAGIELEYISIEKLNIKQKNGILMQIKDEVYTDDTAGELIEKENIRAELLQSHEDLNKTTKIQIPEKNIIQIELISNNNISNLPLYGEPIGLKSFMGIGSSTFIAKMIFDESDSAILNDLKTISDKDTTKTIMNIKNFLPNILDFNSASLNKIFFNNTEEANGVMVTMLFEINSYYYDLSRLLNIGGTDKDLTYTINSTLSVQQNTKLNNVKANNLYTTSFWLETTAQQIFLEKIISDSTLDSFLKTPIESYSQSEKGESMSVLGALESGSQTVFNVEDFLKSYTSYITRFDEETFVKDIKEYNKYLNIKTKNYDLTNWKWNKEGLEYLFKRIGELEVESNEYNDIYQELNPNNLPLNRFKTFLNKTDFKTIFVQELINSSNFYNYFDGIGVLKFFGSDFAKAVMDYYFNNSKDPFNNFVNKTINNIFNENTTRENLMSLNMKRFFYASYFANIFEIINRKTIKEEEFITSNGVNFVKIKETLDTLYDYNIDNFGNSLDSPALFDESVLFVIEEMRKSATKNKEALKEHENVSLFHVNRDLIEPYHEQFVKDFKNKSRYANKDNKDVAYSIFLTKLNYAFTKDYKNINFADTAELNKYINSLVLSTALMSLLLVNVEGMTANFGFISKDLSNNIGYKLNSYLYIGEKKFGEKEIFEKVFGKCTVNSYYKDKLNFFPWLNVETVEEVNKDYNYFYGTKISKNSFGIFEDSLNREESVLASSYIDEFIETKKREYVYSIKNTEKDNNIVPIPSYPTSYSYEFFEKINDKVHINERMKKRILGNMDPFDIITKVKNTICDLEQEAIPDYKIVIGNTDKENNSGIFLNRNVKNYFELTNIAELKISKNPKSKIKNANIIMLDFNKQLVNLSNQGTSISVKAKKDGKIELFEISLGDNVTIELGYGENKKNVFNGYISTINNNGNVVEINASGFASALYSNILKDVDFFENPFLQTFKLAWKGVKAGLNQIPVSEALTVNNIYRKFIERKNPNEHLFKFNGEGAEGEQVDYSMPDQEGFESSMFIVFTKLLALLPKNVKDVIGGYTQSSGASVLFKKILDDNKVSNSFTKTGNITNLDGNSNIYKNILNVDVDYETYGIVNTSPNNEEIQSISSIPEIKEPLIKDIQMNMEMMTNTAYLNQTNMSKEYYKSTNDIKIEGVEIKDNTDKIPDVINPDNEIKKEKGFIFPTESKRVTSKFSPNRWHPVRKKYTKHRGIDIGSKKPGTKYDDFILASKSGVIIDSFFSNSGGEMIVIDHGNNLKTRYLHLSKRFVRPGQKVYAGQKIGLMGNTGLSQAKHLHFEVLLKNIPKNPMDYLEDEGVKYV